MPQPFVSWRAIPIPPSVSRLTTPESDGIAVLVTKFIDGQPLPEGSAKIDMMGDLLGRLHTLAPDITVRRAGGAGGDDPRRAGSSRQDLWRRSHSWMRHPRKSRLPIAHREPFERLRAQVIAADDGSGLPGALLHGNLLHDPDHALLTPKSPVAINWKSAGIGPRLADIANLLWGTGWAAVDGVQVAVRAYRRHIALTVEELDRLEAIMFIRPLYLTCVDYRRAVIQGGQPDGSEDWWGFIDLERIRTTAAAREAFSR